jgi:hypothetical protein
MVALRCQHFATGDGRYQRRGQKLAGKSKPASLDTPQLLEVPAAQGFPEMRFPVSA